MKLFTELELMFSEQPSSSGHVLSSAVATAARPFVVGRGYSRKILVLDRGYSHKTLVLGRDYCRKTRGVSTVQFDRVDTSRRIGGPRSHTLAVVKCVHLERTDRRQKIQGRSPAAQQRQNTSSNKAIGTVMPLVGQFNYSLQYQIYTVELL